MSKTDWNHAAYTLIEKKSVSEADSICYHFEHKQTKAQVVYLSNKDKNKVFSVAFRTPTTNSTGVAHILEHSVLNGSKKYPVKEPFAELLKGSLKTFLNAMTYPDKTIYPIASMNDKDYMNLMDVYLDAVFFPKIYENELIFMQEGWHYHLEKKKDALRYNGVVYNEMKGAYSNPDEVLIDNILESLYSATPYEHSTGGKPEEILSLTYEEFLDFHKKYYHPSNSIVYFYGDGDISMHLSYLDEQYLRHFQESTPAPLVPARPKKKVYREIVDYYPITDEEETTGKDIAVLAYAVGNAKDAALRMSFQILEKMLTSYASSPIKLAFQDAKIGKEIEGHYETDLYYYTVMFLGRDLSEESDGRFAKLIESTLQEVVEKGIDKDLIEASINMYEFALRDVDNTAIPKGLHYNIDVLDGMLYGLKPQTHLSYEKILKKIKAKAGEGYFEQLIQKYLLDNKHKTSVVLKPKKGLQQAREKKREEALRAVEASLTEQERQTILERTKKLIKWQNTADSKAKLNKIPVVPKSEIKDPEPSKLLQDNGLYIYSAAARDIVSMDVYFDISAIDPAKYHYINLLSACLGEMATKHYELSDLSNAISIYTGSMDFAAMVNKHALTNMPWPQVLVNVRFLFEKREKALELVNEILHETILNDKKRLFEIVAKEAAIEKNKILHDARGILFSRLGSYLSSAGALQNDMQSLAYYDFIENVYQHFDEHYEQLVTEMQALYEEIFSKAEKKVLLALDDGHIEEMKKLSHTYFAPKEGESAEIVYPYRAKNEALISATDVNYVGRAYDFVKAGGEYCGSMQVMKTILQTDYLWNNIRVRGGAYGAFFTVERSGAAMFATYRDPHVARSFDVIKNAGAFLANIDYDDKAMHKFIIGTISSLDMPLPPLAIARREFFAYQSGISFQERLALRHEILSATQQDIRKLGGLFAEMETQQHYVCAVLSPASAKENKSFFAEERYLIK